MQNKTKKKKIKRKKKLKTWYIVCPIIYVYTEVKRTVHAYKYREAP